MNKYFIAFTPKKLAESEALRSLMPKLKRTASDRKIELRWTPPELWHVTLEFLGQLNPEQLAAARRALVEWSGEPASSIQLKFNGLSAFPDPRQARVLFIKVVASQGLMDLQSHLRSHLINYGVPTEDREFVPHLTLARFRNLQSAESLIQIAEHKSFGKFDVEDIVLMQSVVEGNIGKYIEIARRPISDSGLAHLE